MQGFDLGFGQGPVHAAGPPLGSGDRPGTEQGVILGTVSAAAPQAGPPPLGGALDQSRAHRVTLDVARHRQEVLVGLDRKGLEAALIQWPGSGGVEVGVPPAHVRSGNPVMEIRQLAVGGWYEEQVPVIAYQR